MKKKIAIIIERTDILLGGAERSVSELASALSAQGQEVCILAAKGEQKSKNVHILCQDLPGRRTCYTAFAKALRNHLAENPYDIIHSCLPFDFADVYQPRGGSLAESILRNAASYRNKFLQSYKRVTAFANFRRAVLLRAERRLCKNSHGPVVAALSQYVADQFKNHYNLSDDRLAIIPNGINVNKHVDTLEAGRLRDQVLNQLGLKEPDNPVLFLFVANNFRLKGLAALIKAIKLAATSPATEKAYFVIAGHDKSHKYRHMARQLNVDKRIVFLGPIRNIQNALSIADVAILPTFYDPSSRYILEAIVAGKPVITTRFNGATDLFVDNRHGKVIDRPENISALAEAISHFSEQDNIMDASQAIIADNLKEKIAISRVVGQLESLYDSILEKRRGI